MSMDGKKPLGDSSVIQKGRKGAMRVIYGRTAIIAVSFLAQIYSDRRRSEFLPSVHTDVFRRLYGAWTRHCAFDSE